MGHKTTTSNMNAEDQPALGPDGKLLDASQIEWFHDPDDHHSMPVQPTTIPQGTAVFNIKFIYLFSSWSY